MIFQIQWRVPGCGVCGAGLLLANWGLHKNTQARRLESRGRSFCSKRHGLAGAVPLCGAGWRRGTSAIGARPRLQREGRVTNLPHDGSLRDTKNSGCGLREKVAAGWQAAYGGAGQHGLPGHSREPGIGAMPRLQTEGRVTNPPQDAILPHDRSLRDAKNSICGLREKIAAGWQAAYGGAAQHRVAECPVTWAMGARPRSQSERRVENLPHNGRVRGAGIADGLGNGRAHV
jgi:hypothetical protein